MVEVGIGDALDIVRKILWCQTMQASVNEHSQVTVTEAIVLCPVLED